MIGKIIKRAAGLSVFALIFSASVFAQTTQIEGTVKVKGEDGKLTPVPNAVVDIFRTDMKGQWDVKTDKNGRYIRLGMPLQGTFVVAVSAPGIQPTFIPGVRLVTGAPIDLIAIPGDGSRLTFEQVQQALAREKGAPAGPSAPQPSAADRAKAEEMKKEYEAKAKEAQELQSSYKVAVERYNLGVQKMNTDRNFEAALAEFEPAAALDATKHEALAELAYKANANIAEAHYQLGVDHFNKRNRDEAKAHFQKAVEAINKSISLASAAPPDKNPNIANDLLIYYNILGKNSLLLIEHFGAVDRVEPTIAFIDKAEAADTVNKNKWAVMRADIYRFSGRTDDAIAAYKKAVAADPNNIDALYGLGLTLIAATEKEKIQEGANALGEFVSKAPPTDRRVPDVKAALDAVKEAYKVEAEKPAPRRRGKP